MKAQVSLKALQISLESHLQSFLAFTINPLMIFPRGNVRTKICSLNTRHDIKLNNVLLSACYYHVNVPCHRSSELELNLL